MAPRAVRILCLLAIAALVGWLTQIGGLHILRIDPDFEFFYKAGAWLLEHGAFDPGYDLVDGRAAPRGTLDWYLPFVPRLMTLLAWLPPVTAGFVWLALNIAAVVCILRLVGRHLTGLPPQDWPVTQLVPLLIVLVYWAWEFRLNQINTLTLLLLVGSYVCWEQRRPWPSGLWLGLAVLLKLTPGLLIVWFALKRQYRVVAAALLTVILCGPVSDALVLGPADAVESYRAWARRAVTSGSHRGLILEQREMDWRNQGLGAVLSRWLHPTSYSTHFDNDPRHELQHGLPEVRTLNVANLPRPVVAGTALVAAALSLLALLLFARRPAGALTVWQLRLEWGLFLLAMLWLMPVMRRYHFIWAYPAVGVIGAAVHYMGRGRTWSRIALLCLGLVFLLQIPVLFMRLEAVGVWSGSWSERAEMLAMRAEASGTVLASVAVLALPLVLLLRRLQRDPDALPPPALSPPRFSVLSGGRLVRVGVVCLLILLGLLSFDRARRGRYDFHHFYLDAEYVWTHGALNPDVAHSESDEERQLPFYLPVVPLLLSPLTALGRNGAAVVWAVLQMAALAYSLRVLYRWGQHGRPEIPSWAPLALAVVLALPAFLEAARFNQLSYFILALLLAGALALQRGRNVLGGALLGLAAVMKLLPGIFLIWLLLKRRWTAATALVGTAAAVTLLPPLLAFGPQRTLAYHREWAQYNIIGQSAGSMLDPSLPEHFIDRRNQSITHVLARWTWPEHPHAVARSVTWARPPVELSRERCLWLGRALTVILGLALLAATARPWRQLSETRLLSEFAAYALSMLVFSPLLRQYYLVWALPALVMLGRIAAESTTRHRARLAQAGLVVWLVGMLLWAWPAARLMGAHLVMLIVMGILLLALSREVRAPSRAESA